VHPVHELFVSVLQFNAALKKNNNKRMQLFDGQDGGVLAHLIRDAVGHGADLAKVLPINDRVVEAPTRTARTTHVTSINNKKSPL
jgi:hypothetical protein